MIYCVVPPELADELYPQMVERYKDDPNVTVIVDRRDHDRRARGAAASQADRDRRTIRDRRRARVPGELPPLVEPA